MKVIRIKPTIQEALDNIPLLNTRDYGWSEITPDTVEAGEVFLADKTNIKNLWLDAFYPPMLPHKFVYYFVKIYQSDGEIAWSSPIWLSDIPIIPFLNK